MLDWPAAPVSPGARTTATLQRRPTPPAETPASAPVSISPGLQLDACPFALTFLCAHTYPRTAHVLCSFASRRKQNNRSRNSSNNNNTGLRDCCSKARRMLRHTVEVLLICLFVASFLFHFFFHYGASGDGGREEALL